LGLQVLHYWWPRLDLGPDNAGHWVVDSEAPEDFGRSVVAAENRRIGSILQRYPRLIGDCEHGRLFSALEPCCGKDSGLYREELTARPFFDFVHPDDVDRTRETVSALGSQQKVFLFENRYRCKDGTYRWLEWSSVPAGKLIYAAARDVTERKQAEQALEERLRFETLLAEISAHFINLPVDRIDSQIEYAQRRICELLDLDRSTLWEMREGEPRALLLTRLHQPPGSLPRVEQLNAIDSFPWAAQKVLDGEMLIISKMTDLPPEAAETGRIFVHTAPSPTC